MEIDGKVKIELGESNHDRKIREAEEKRLEARSQRSVAYNSGVEQWRPLCEKYFGNQANNCLKAMKRESGGNPRAVSHTQDYGLLQIHYPIWGKFFGISKEQLFDPETNVKCAKVIYDRSGWYAWVTMR